MEPSVQAEFQENRRNRFSASPNVDAVRFFRFGRSWPAGAPKPSLREGKCHDQNRMADYGFQFGNGLRVEWRNALIRPRIVRRRW